MDADALADIRRLDAMVDHWADRKPDALALVFGDQKWTWRQFQQRGEKLAAALVAAGVRPGDRVASYDKNHVACLELTQAASRVGAVNTVVNFRLAPDEVAYVLEDAGATVLFVGHEFVEVWKQIADRINTVRKVVVVGGSPDEYEELLASAPAYEGVVDVQPDDAVNQLYTSGTTGFPKGAVLSHRALLAHTRACTELFQTCEGRVSLVAMPLFHVGGSSYSLIALYAGVPTVLVREAHPTYLLPAIEENGANQAFLVPALIGMLLAAGEPAIHALGKLEALAYGASPMPLPLLERCVQLLPTTVSLMQVYGLTEVSGVATSLADGDHRDPRSGTGCCPPARRIRVSRCGSWIPGTSAPAEQGVSGEVQLRTEQVMTGYWNRAQATAEAIDSDGWFHTGDIGYLDEDGYLFIHDRLKDMIISGGENIYSSEVENAVAAHPSVADVSVIGIADEKWGEAVRAVVVPVPGQRIDAAEIIEFCRGRLAHYKCPKSIVVTETAA
ncbi:AMP-binding protein [Fodinicola feengrottensis]|uniref:AMP-binding protein n=1 Tax=Fodinicola feengrottensis TaxID=435914 RepID=UPI0024427592|nr:AMP-binding protein [Fodinicola feengrottensis]